MKFNNLNEFNEYLNYQREEFKNDSRLEGIEGIAIYRIPLLDSIVHDKIMEEYLLRNIFNGITKSYVVTRNKKDDFVWLVEQYQKNQQEIDMITQEHDSKFEARLSLLNEEIKKKGVNNT